MNDHTGPEPAPTVRGLSTQQAAARLVETGPNVLPERQGPGPLLIFMHQFKSPFIYVLFAAAVVSLGLGQTINAVFITIVLLINALIGAMYTPGLRDILQIQPVSIVQWSQLLGVALTLIAVDELHKLWHSSRGRVQGA